METTPEEQIFAVESFALLFFFAKVKWNLVSRPSKVSGTGPCVHYA